MLIVRKATAFVTREGDSGREVLVFTHPHAGVQLPAGTVEAGETFEQGVLREVHEETGLSDVTILADLATIELIYDGKLRRAVEDSTLLRAPHGEATECVIERGILVDLVEEQDGFAHVKHRDDLDPYFLYPSISGWIPSTAVQPHRVVRHLFHLQSNRSTPDEWKHIAEGIYPFRFYWVNVNDTPTLAGQQQSWWDAVIDRLRV